MKPIKADASTQDILLQKLEEFGNSLEYDEDDTKSTPKRKHRNSSQYVLSPSEDKIKKKKKKNRKKKSVNSEMFRRTKDELNLDKKQLSKKEQWLKDVLGAEAITDKSVSNHSCDQNQNETLQTLSNHKRKFEPEVVVFHDPAKRKKKVSEDESTNNTGSTDTNYPDFDLRQARYDVRKFGIKGFDEMKKDEAMTSLLVSLGAKPPKNKYYNYKEYQQKRKQERQEEQNKEDKSFGIKVSKKKKKRTRDPNDIGTLGGQIGTFKSGVQFIKKQDVKLKK